MDYSHFAILALAFGIAMLIAEIFIPSGGMILIVAIISLVASVWCAWNAWGESDTSRFVWFLVFGGLLLPVSAGGALYIFPRTSFGRRVLLEAPEHEDIHAFVQEEQRLSRLIGKTGKTLTLMSPGGLVMIDGERLHSESEGVVLEPGEAVKVIAMKGNRLVVRAVSGGDQIAQTDDGFDDDSEETQNPPLDFELPQS